MRKVWYLVIAITGNALGTALMEETDLGMTAWGSAARNFSNYFDISLGMGFIILSVFFYVLATCIRREFILNEMIQSTIFLLSFSFLSDFFIYLIPSLSNLNDFFRLLINIFGMLILMFSIAVHIRVHIAVHPMDVFLYVMQKKLKSISIGTYLSYFMGFLIAVVFGLLHRHIDAIGVGTMITLISSGYVMHFYNKYILDKWSFE